MSTTERKKMDEGQAAFYPSFPPPHNARAVRSVSTHPPNTGRPRGAPPGSICEAGRAVSGTTPPPDWPHPRQGLPHNGNAGCARGFNASAGGHRGEEADPQCIDPPPPRHRPRGWPRPHRQPAATVVALTTPEPNRRRRFPLTHSPPPPARSARARTSGVGGRPDPVRAPHATIRHLPPPSLPPPSPKSPQPPPPPRPPTPPPPPTSYGPRLRR